MSRRALYLLAAGTRVEDWREHLERGEGRGLFDAETVAIAWEEFAQGCDSCHDLFGGSGFHVPHRGLVNNQCDVCLHRHDQVEGLGQ